MRDVFELEPGTEILADDPYIASYPHLLEFFEPKNSFTVGDVVCGAHMVYGWMPTILELYPDAERCDLQAAGDMLTKAKQGLRLEAWEIDALDAQIVASGPVQCLELIENVRVWHASGIAFALQAQLDRKGFIGSIQRAQSPRDHPMCGTGGFGIIGPLTQHHRPLELRQGLVVSLKLMQRVTDVIAE